MIPHIVVTVTAKILARVHIVTTLKIGTIYIVFKVVTIIVRIAFTTTTHLVKDATITICWIIWKVMRMTVYIVVIVTVVGD
jgi:hypothetical protein